MKAGLKRYAEQLLFASNIFIAFLLFFESKLVIPSWLQTVGRMHPLILHFPIVLLLIAMMMEFFRFRPENATNTFYRNFSQNLLLAGTLFAALTVIMGLFLSREEGYTGDTLDWHKWTGAAIFFFSSLIYWIRDSSWYRLPVARSGAVLTVVGLILTGHYGAALTHGENFVMEPLMRDVGAPKVPVEQAIVFDHIIMPILQQKCVSCHNPDKLKGELLLTDAKGLLKGGKSGKLFVSGNPEISLLLERIHLPDDDKKHMPPTGKPQLTADEVRLLALWVKDDADFKKKVTALPEGDTLRTLAVARLAPSQKEDDQYDFPTADEKTIAKLNTDYRTIMPLARELPALSVNLYNRATYSTRQIDELDEIKKQVVSLNLNKMPIKDEDLKSVAKLENLRRLDLNFTDVTAAGLKHLTGLKHLHTLTLTGTKVDFKGLQAQLPGLKALRSVSVWETGVKGDEVAALQKKFGGITIIGGFRDDGKNPLKLNPVQVNQSLLVFGDKVPLELRHPVKNVQIRFTTDGTVPDSVNSPVFDGKTIISENTTVKARAFKEGWYGSDLSIFNFYRNTFVPDSVTVLFPLSRVHQAEGNKTFFNKKMGVIGANNPAWANNWAGARDNDIAILAEFDNPVAVSSVGVHYMIEESTGIFPPELVEVWGGADRHHLKLLGKFKAKMPTLGEPSSLQAVDGKFKTQTVSCLKIVARPLSKIPDWHRSKGNKALLLVDEMFIN